MKSFFKKLSLVLAAAMVITMVPAQVAKAAPVTLKIAEESKKAEAVASPTYNLKVKDEIDLTFVGATGYNSAAAATKKWTSKDPTVATVDAKSGVVKALKPGTTVITVICTAKGIDYQGTATIIVSDSKTEVLQTGEEEITAYFANEADATAAAKTAKVYLVQRAQKTTRLRDSKATVKAVGDTVVITNVHDGLEYQVNIAGGEYNVVMSVGDPDTIRVEYPKVQIGTGNDLTGTTVKKGESKPVITVLDADQKKLNYDIAKFQFSITEHVSKAGIDKKGVVTFSSGDPKSSAKVKVTYKFTNSAGKSDEKTTTASVAAEAYVIPTLDGWADSIVAVKPGTKAKDITYPTADDFEAKLNIGESLELAFVIGASDRKTYTGANVKATAEDKDVKKITAITNGDYKFYFEKDDPEKIFVSLPSAKEQVSTNFAGRVTVKAWKQGTETISLYRAKDKSNPNSNVDMYLGSITIKVNEERRLDKLEIRDNQITGYIDAAKPVVEIDLAAKDQFGDKIKAEVVVTAKNADVQKAVTASVENDSSKSGYGTGKIKIDFSKIPATGDKDPYTVTLTAKYADGVSTEFTVEAVKLASLTNPSQEFKVEIAGDNATIKNKSFADATAINNIGFTITVGNYINDIKTGNVDFRLVNDVIDEFDSDIDLTKIAAKYNVNDLFVVLFDAEEKVIPADQAGIAIPSLFATGTGAAATRVSYFFDLYKKGEDLVKSIYTPGAIKAVLYYVDEEGQPQAVTETAIVEVANKMELITSVDSTYALKADNNNVVKQTKNDKAVEVEIPTSYAFDDDLKLVATIIGSLYGWFDKNSDGKAQSTEVDTIANLTGGFTVNKNLSKAYSGAPGEAYINYVVIEYKIDGATVQQMIPVDRKFKIK